VSYEIRVIIVARITKIKKADMMSRIRLKDIIAMARKNQIPVRKKSKKETHIISVT
jgi:hypothetical protein